MADDAEPDALARLRGLALLMPEASEVDILDSTAFRVATNMFAEFRQLDGGAVVTVKLAADRQAEIVMAGDGQETPETGGHGWTSIPLGPAPDWDLIDELVIESYRGLAPPHCMAQLDAMLEAADQG